MRCSATMVSADTGISKMVPSCGTQPRVFTKYTARSAIFTRKNSVRNLVGGATLEKHWNDGKALSKIKEGHLDYVVLQDLSKQAYADKDSLLRHGRLFDGEIHKIGARTVLYMTWPLDDSLNNYGAIADAYT